MTERVNTPRIVVGVDGSQPSKQALRWAIEQARLTGATVEAILTWEFPLGYGWGPVVEDVETLVKGSEQVLADAITEVAGEFPAVTIHGQVIEGHPAYVLQQAAAGAQLLVLGSRGHGGFVGALLGSVSQYCVQHATCPVVIIRGPTTAP
jgi:nucleotide-binding universal stress UspA family protein